MDLAELVRAMIDGQSLEVRQQIADALHAGFDWSAVPEPSGLSDNEAAVAAGLVELMAARTHTSPPAWTAPVGAASEPIYLVASARTMRRTRELCETHGPLSFRKRRILALPNCYTFA